MDKKFSDNIMASLVMIEVGLEDLGSHWPGYAECKRGHEQMEAWYREHGEPERGTENTTAKDPE